MAKWHFSRNDETHGPISADELRQLAESGQLSPEDLIWKEGMDSWKPAGKLKGLFRSTTPPPLPSKKSGRTQLDDAGVTLSTSAKDAALASVSAPAAFVQGEFMIPLSEKGFRKRFERKKENLTTLQADITEWFKARNFEPTASADDGVLLVVGSKESAARQIFGTRQKFYAKIEPESLGYTVEFGEAKLAEKSGWGMLATFGASYVTLGIPAVVGFVQQGTVAGEFSQWLDERSKRICPSCEISSASQFVRRTVVNSCQEEREINDDLVVVTTESSTNEFRCQFCSHLWNDGITDASTFEIDCPSCNRICHYPVDALNSSVALKCTFCGTAFETIAQEMRHLASNIRFWEAQIRLALVQNDMMRVQALQLRVNELRRQLEMM